MNILILGDSHTYGFGLPSGQLSYVGHFIRQISRTGRSVSVEAYAHQTIQQIQTTLSQLTLNRYDLILVQINPDCQSVFPLDTVCSLPINWSTLPAIAQSVDQASTAPASLLKRVETRVSTLWSVLFHTSHHVLTPLLDVLRPYRHNVLLLSPFPSLNPARQRIGQYRRNVLLREADNQLFSVFDSDSVVQPREEYFLTKHADYLNGISHELIGHALYDFYQSAPTIVTVQSVRRR